VLSGELEALDLHCIIAHGAAQLVETRSLFPTPPGAQSSGESPRSRAASFSESTGHLVTYNQAPKRLGVSLIVWPILLLQVSKFFSKTKPILQQQKLSRNMPHSGAELT
jgi:hypothetical protein